MSLEHSRLRRLDGQSRAAWSVPPSRRAALAELLEPRRHMDAGDFDTSFSDDGVVSFLINNGGVTIADIVVDPRDGSAIIAGSTTVGERDFVLIRVLPDGRPDPNFGVSGIIATVSPPGGNDIATSVTLDADGKILVAGYTQYFDPFTGELVDEEITLARFLPNGTRDIPFGPFGSGYVLIDFVAPVNTIERANALAVQPDGKIVLAGLTNRDDPTSFDFALVRLTPQGLFDPTFAEGGVLVTPFPGSPGRFEQALAVAVQPDGKIVAGGEIQFTGTATGIPESRALVARYLPNGDLDLGFGEFAAAPATGRTGVVVNTFRDRPDPLTSDLVSAIAIDPAGRIVLGGLTVTQSASGAFVRSDFGVGRLTPDGRGDATFAGDGFTTTDMAPFSAVTEVGIQEDGKVVAGGITAASVADVEDQNFGVGVTRYTDAGSLDPAFGNGGRLLFNPSFQVVQATTAAIARSLRPAAAGDPVLQAEADNDRLDDFQETAQGLIAITPRGRILIVATQGNQVNVAAVLGSGPPTAGLTAANLTQAGVAAIEFRVQYADDVLVSFASLDGNDVVVIAPGGGTLSVTLVAVEGGSANADVLVGVYRLAAPGGTFTAADDGTYTVNLQANQVADAAGDAAAAAALGTFAIQIGGGGGNPTEGPDLVAGAVSGRFPAAVVGGSRGGTATVPVTNSGNRDARGLFTIRLLTSTDTAVDGGDVVVVTMAAQKINLKPGRSKSYRLRFANFPSPPDGNYFLLAEVDTTDAFDELNEGNNVGATAAPLNIAAPFVDLSGTFAPPPAGLAAGKKARLSVTIRNDGNVPAVGTTTTNLLLSTDRNADGGDTPLTGLKPLRLNLKPGAAKTFRLAPLVPATPGSFFVAAVLDAANGVTERNEANNVLFTDGMVTVA